MYRLVVGFLFVMVLMVAPLAQAQQGGVHSSSAFNTAIMGAKVERNNDRWNKLISCEKQGYAFAPGHAQVDGNQCLPIDVAAMAISMTAVLDKQGKIETCSDIKKYYDPDDPGADANGCAAPAAASGVPSGTIAAFFQATCPAGWTEATALRGRTIIGAGQGGGLTNRPLGQYGGAENHTLTVAQMPSHSHSFTAIYTYQGVSANYPGTIEIPYENQGSVRNYNTVSVGSNQPHNNMPPYLAMLYCQKS